MLAALLGMLIGTTFMALHGSQGPHLGLPQMIQSRAQFGHRGVVLPILAAIFVFVANNIIDMVLIGLGVGNIAGIPARLVGWIAVVIGFALALLGHHWLHRIFSTLLWFALPLLTVGVLVGGVPAGHAPAASSGGFNLVDYFVLRRGHFDVEALLRPSSRYGLWSGVGLSAYAIGLGSMVPFLAVPGLVTGPLAWWFGGADLSWMVGLAVSAGAYALLAARRGRLSPRRQSLVRSTG